MARSTFYAHFQNKAALLDFGFEQAFSEVHDMLSRTRTAPGELQTLNWLVDHIHQNRAIYERFPKSNSDQIVFTRFQSAANQMLRIELGALAQNASHDEVNYVVGGCFSIIQKWVEDRPEFNPTELKKVLHTQAGRTLRRN